MRVAVTGGSGFLGSRFVELYKDTFSDMIILNSKNAPLNNFDKLLDITSDIDILVHTAFDHSYKDNILGIKNILKVCEQNKIKKFIHISTISVYNPNIKGTLNEESEYTAINDPYSKEKKEIEKEIERYKNSSIKIIILQPTIIYGLGGNWTKYALHVCKSKSLSIPNDGKDICNAVYIDDVVNAIYQSCISSVKYEKILISSSENITWRKFYEKQCDILKDLKLPSVCNIIDNINKNEFHSKGIVNFIFLLWFKTPFGNIFNLALGILKKLRAKSYKNTSSKEKLKEFIKSNTGENVLTPLGITKKVHSCKFNVDISKAVELLNYTPQVSFDDGLDKIKDNIKKALL